jgi:protein SCO1/2
MRHSLAALAACAVLAAGCSRPAPSTTRQFPLTGEIVAVRTDRTEVTVRHDEVKGFMPAMTMAFAIKEPALVAGLQPGDLIAATLVLTDEDSYLTAIRKTGTVPPGAHSAPLPEPPPGLRDGEAVPDIMLTFDDGTTAPLTAQRGTLVLLTFIYTRCPLPDYCPRMDRYFTAIQAAVAADPRLKGQVRLLSISFDPEFDTPARLAAHARARGADPAVWRYATAPRAAVDAFGARFGLTVTREGADGSNITHNLRTALVGRDGTLVKTYNGNEWQPPEVVRDLASLAARR